MIIEVFTTGTHTDSAGTTTKFTKEHIDQIVSEHTGRKENDRAAFALGHPKDDGSSPAVAMVKNIFRKGASMFAEMVDLIPELAEAFKKKMFKNVSVAIDGEPGRFKLRHIALLGATPPAVKGLAGIKFSEKDSQVFEFDFAEYEEEKKLYEILKDFFSFGAHLPEDKKKKDMQEPRTDVQTLIFSKEKFNRSQAVAWAKGHDFSADKVDEKEDSFRLRQRDPGDFQPGSFRTIPFGGENSGIQAVIGRPTKQMSSKEDNMEFAEIELKNKSLEEEVKILKADKDKAAKDFKESDEKVKTLAKQIADSEAEKKAKEYTEWTDKQIETNKILPAEKEAVMAMLKTVDGQEAMDFMEGDKKVKKTPLEIYKFQIEQSGERIDMGEFATDGPKSKKTSETAGDKLEEIANKFVEEGKLNFSEAFKKAEADNPNLSNLYIKEIFPTK